MFELFILQSFAVFFLVRLFLITQQFSHFGPFPSKILVVERVRRDADGKANIHTQPVTLLERIRRRTPLNPYMVNGMVWSINPLRVEVWECPKCLTPWVALLVVVPSTLIFSYWFWLPIVLPAVMGCAFWLYRVVEDR